MIVVEGNRQEEGPVSAFDFAHTEFIESVTAGGRHGEGGKRCVTEPV